MSTPDDPRQLSADESDPQDTAGSFGYSRTVAIVGASRDRSKFGNRSVQALGGREYLSYLGVA